MSFDDLHSAAATVPAGAWAVGVSGGADSVALLRLLAARTDLRLHVVHLDHELRGEDSRADAAFTRSLADELRIPSTIELAENVAPQVLNLPKNLEARGRALRMRLYRNSVDAVGLQGVILAHHADDQAETVLMRLLRGSSIWTVRGMRPMQNVNGLHILRPLLDVRRGRLRAFLNAIEQPWREDSSNDSTVFARNRVRKLLTAHPALYARSLELGRASSQLWDWVEAIAPRLPATFAVTDLADRPTLVARWLAAQWLVDRGSPPEECSQSVADGLIEMCRDAASPPRRHFPGGIEVRRKSRFISATTASSAA